MHVELTDIRLVPLQCWSLALRVGLVDALLWLLTNKGSIDNTWTTCDQILETNQDSHMK